MKIKIKLIIIILKHLLMLRPDTFFLFQNHLFKQLALALNYHHKARYLEDIIKILPGKLNKQTKIKKKPTITPCLKIMFKL